MKRLIVCADGTWDTPDHIDTDKESARQEHLGAVAGDQKILYSKPIREPSNVVKMARAIRPSAKDGTAQVVFYDAGVGTGSGLYDKFIGGGTGAGLSKNVLDGYRFLVNNYDEGDEIFLFGFSRGAFTVRSLAGMLGRCGLLAKSDAYYIPEAYEHYLLDDSLPENRAMLAKFRSKDFRKRNHATREAAIKFIGVWDTVGALGLPLSGPIARRFNRKYEFHDVQLSDKVAFAYQALAIDEWRTPFQATLWDPHGPPKAGQVIEQRWFAGAHSNVGGGLNADRLPDSKGKLRSYRLENFAFRWMAAKASAADVGLELDQRYLRFFNALPTCSIRNTLTGFYKLFGKHLRPIGKTRYGNETIDDSVMQRVKVDASYRPANLLEHL